MKTRLSWMFKSATAAAAVALSVASLSTQAADTIKIGMMTESTGPSSEAGIYQANGAKLALDEINQSGGVLGRQFELRNEDNQSTNPGSVLAISKLTSGADLTALIATVRSTQIQAISPTVMRARLPILVGGTDVGLTHANNPWIFRARPNDGYSARVIADYGLNTLKLKKWEIIHSTDAFGNGGKNSLTESLKAAGVTPVLVQGFTSNSQDFTPIVLAIKKSGADILATYMTNSPDVGIFAKQMRQLGVSMPWVGSPSIISVTALNLAGESLYGTYAIADFTTDADEQSRAFTKKYRDKYGINPDTFASWAYDALHILAIAIQKANSTDAEAVRRGILGINGYKGVEGTYVFDQNGDGLHGYSVVKNEGGKIAFIKRVEFPPQ